MSASSDLLAALASVPTETYVDLAKAVLHVARSPDPVDTARRIAEEAARIAGLDALLTRTKG